VFDFRIPLLTFSAAGLLTAANPKPYTLTDLGTFGGTTAQARAINNRGAVVVNATGFSDNLTHCFVVDGRNTIALPPGAQCLAINSRGQVAGTFSTRAGQSAPFVWTNGQLTLLPTLGGNTGQVTAIADNGLMVGWAAKAPAGTPRAAMWDTSGNVTELGPFGGFGNAFDTYASFATGVNNQGQIGGYTLVEAFQATPFRYENGTFTSLPLPDPSGTTRGAVTAGMNEAGILLAGFSGASCDVSSGYQYVGDTPERLPLFGNPESINERGDIAGYRYPNGIQCGYPSQAFVLTGGALTDLPGLATPGSTVAWSINNRGDIAGYASTAFFGGVLHAVIWTK
jgi:probable HAF family extracellular repeat protein